jgi:hypothetical protein
MAIWPTDPWVHRLCARGQAALKSPCALRRSGRIMDLRSYEQRMSRVDGIRMATNGDSRCNKARDGQSGRRTSKEVRKRQTSRHGLVRRQQRCA